MSKIRIKNFGPIRAGYQDKNGWIDIKKVTVFIGNQGSGKSTVAKLISTFTWMEKALTRGDYDPKEFEMPGVLKRYLTYHKIDDYAELRIKGIKQIDRAEIEYEGDSYTFRYKNRELKIDESHAGDYPLPQIMYVPADRNFLSSIEDLKTQRIFSPALREVLDEMDKAEKEIKDDLALPINSAFLEYDKQKDVLHVKGKDYKIKLSEASSGFQSFVPLYLVSWFLSNSVKSQAQKGSINDPMSSEELQRFRKGFAEIWANPSLTDEQRRAALSVLSSKFNKTAFINIVEEPEQNLFPASQWKMLKSLLEFNNISDGNKLIMTTHSPYIINYLNIAIEGKNVEIKIDSSGQAHELLTKIDNIIPLKSLVSSDDVVIYQLNEEDGSISKLSTFDGIPSDKNYLNMSIREGNQLFDSLLEIEEEI